MKEGLIQIWIDDGSFVIECFLEYASKNDDWNAEYEWRLHPICKDNITFLKEYLMEGISIDVIGFLTQDWKIRINKVN